MPLVLASAEMCHSHKNREASIITCSISLIVPNTGLDIEHMLSKSWMNELMNN